MKTFYLIDGHAQIFRAYYAPFRPLTSPTGEPTKAVFVFTQMILNILREKRPDYLAVTLDFGDDTTLRKEFYPEYKANRDESPEDLSPQIRRIEEILHAMNIPVYSERGYEADDLIATTASRLSDEDLELFIVSKDKDLHQVLTDKIKLWDPQTDRSLDASTLLEEKGYAPDQAVEIQTLTGDSTDNVPGVPGIGPKKALQLIQKYGTANDVYEHAHELTPKMRQNVLDSKNVIELSRKLVTLDQNVDFPFELEHCAAKRIQTDGLPPIFEELGFRRLLDLVDAPTEGGGGRRGETSGGKDREDASPPRSRSVEGDYSTVDTPEKLEEFLTLLRDQPRFAIDTETTSVHPVDCELIGLSFSWKEGTGWYLPLRSNTGPTLDVESTLDALRPMLEDPAIEKFGQNIKYDWVVLRVAGVRLRGIAFDSMVASYLACPERRGHSMDALAGDLLGLDPVPISELIGTGKKQISMLDADAEKLAHYASEDADVTWRLREALAPRLEESALESLFHEVELPLVEVLGSMEYYGVRIDSDRLRAFGATLASRLDDLRAAIHAAAGREFNVDSPKQLAEILFDEIGLRVVKKTKTSRSTDASVLETLRDETEHPVPSLVLEYRELNKLKNTYVDVLPAMVSPRTGRLHASFNQTVAATGRLSSSDPNLQNIPIRTELGREIRRAFVPQSPDRVLIAADYSQIELRVLAHLSQDENLLEAFRSDQDIHAAVAAQIFGVGVDDVTSEQRARAKAVNFGIVYGQGAFGLSRSLKISRADAASFIDDYKAKYPGIVAFMDQCVAAAESEGLVTTMLGRHRLIPGNRLAQSRAAVARRAARDQYGRSRKRGGHDQSGHGPPVPPHRERAAGSSHAHPGAR